MFVIEEGVIIDKWFFLIKIKLKLVLNLFNYIFIKSLI